MTATEAAQLASENLKPYTIYDNIRNSAREGGKFITVIILEELLQRELISKGYKVKKNRNNGTYTISWSHIKL